MVGPSAVSDRPMVILGRLQEEGGRATGADGRLGHDVTPAERRLLGYLIPGRALPRRRRAPFASRTPLSSSQSLVIPSPSPFSREIPLSSPSVPALLDKKLLYATEPSWPLCLASPASVVVEGVRSGEDTKTGASAGMIHNPKAYKPWEEKNSSQPHLAFPSHARLYTGAAVSPMASTAAGSTQPTLGPGRDYLPMQGQKRPASCPYSPISPYSTSPYSHSSSEHWAPIALPPGVHPQTVLTQQDGHLLAAEHAS
ncbi:uncharacterized protein VTP21DRAFT_1218 [Calcarisporiella thermophila]|uniref:uncharacterized protein n=1 Tax=Calcarisporiella thermophila TaxID=911321 RepID=UPI0037446CD7